MIESCEVRSANNQQQDPRPQAKEKSAETPAKDAVFPGSSAAGQSDPPEERNTGVEGVSSVFEGVSATNP